MATQASPSGDVDAGDLPFPLQDQERVLLVSRRHWIHLWPKTAYLLLWGILPPVLVGFLLSWADQYDGTVALVFQLAALGWMLYWALRIYLNWYRYRHDLWVITNQRIVDSLKANPFSHRLSTADLVNVQDMTVERHGVLQTMLNYGDIVCETASESGDFVLSGIPRPSDVQLLVDRERDRERRGR